MELRADSTVPFPRELVFRTYRDELPELVEFMTNIRRIEVKNRDEDGDVTRLLNVWHGGGDIPSAARIVLSENMLSWDDVAEWRASNWVCEWRISTHSFTDAIHCRGTNRFIELDGGTRVEIRGDLTIDATKIKGVPRLMQGTVKKTVEEFLVRKIAPNLAVVGDGLSKYLGRHSAEGTA